jgi:hypothetical protein
VSGLLPSDLKSYTSAALSQPTLAEFHQVKV